MIEAFATVIEFLIRWGIWIGTFVFAVGYVWYLVPSLKSLSLGAPHLAKEHQKVEKALRLVAWLEVWTRAPMLLLYWWATAIIIAIGMIILGIFGDWMVDALNSIIPVWFYQVLITVISVFWFTTRLRLARNAQDPRVAEKLGSDAAYHMLMEARKPNQHETMAYLNHLPVSPLGKDATTPMHIMVLDVPAEKAYCFGSTLYLTTGLMQSDHLEVMYIHSHVLFNVGWASALAYVHRLIDPKPTVDSTDLPHLEHPLLSVVLGKTGSRKGDFSLPRERWSGGLGVSRKEPELAQLSEQITFVADAITAELGYRDELVAYLKKSAPNQFTSRWIPSPHSRIEQLRLLSTAASHASVSGTSTIAKPSDPRQHDPGASHSQ